MGRKRDDGENGTKDISRNRGNHKSEKENHMREGYPSREPSMWMLECLRQEKYNSYENKR